MTQFIVVAIQRDEGATLPPYTHRFTYTAENEEDALRQFGDWREEEEERTEQVITMIDVHPALQ